MKNKIIGNLSFIGFLAAIPFANWWLTQNGMWDAPALGPIPSAVWVVAFTFVLRDIVQITLGKKIAWIAIIIGTIFSLMIATPEFALASGVAFAVSETFDAGVFTPLANRGRFVLGVILSGVVGGAIDSLLFVRIAFGSFSGWWQLAIAKAIVIVIATPVAIIARKNIK